jgi:hypothetical protein
LSNFRTCRLIRSLPPASQRRLYESPVKLVFPQGRLFVRIWVWCRLPRSLIGSRLPYAKTRTGCTARWKLTAKPYDDTGHLRSSSLRPEGSNYLPFHRAKRSCLRMAVFPALHSLNQNHPLTRLHRQCIESEAS